MYICKLCLLQAISQEKKSIFTSGPANGVIFAFLRKFSAFFFLLLHFLCRLLFIIVQMLTFKRKLFWGLEYPFNGIFKRLQTNSKVFKFCRRFSFSELHILTSHLFCPISSEYSFGRLELVRKEFVPRGSSFSSVLLLVEFFPARFDFRLRPHYLPLGL